MTRPRSVTLTAWLMGLLSLIGWTLIDWNRYRPPHHTHAGFITFTVAIIAMKAFALVCVWYYYEGRNWARIAVLFTSVWTVYNLRLLGNRNCGVVYYGVVAVEGLLGLFLLYWLNTSDLRRFFSSAQSRVD